LAANLGLGPARRSEALRRTVRELPVAIPALNWISARIKLGGATEFMRMTLVVLSDRTIKW
jgi:hypothetical protein